MGAGLSGRSPLLALNREHVSQRAVRPDVVVFRAASVRSDADTSILDLELFQAPGVVDVHPAEVRLPPVVRPFGDAVLPAHVVDRLSGLDLLQHTDDLLFAVPSLAHLLLLRRPSLSPDMDRTTGSKSGSQIPPRVAFRRPRLHRAPRLRLPSWVSGRRLSGASRGGRLRSAILVNPLAQSYAILEQ